MTLPGTAPTSVVAARDRFLELSSVTATLGASAANFYYPRTPNSAALPVFTVERTTVQGERASAGGSYINGTMSVVLHVDGTPTTGMDDGTLEGIAEGICTSLCELLTDGLFIKRVTAGRCSDPSPGMFAGSDAGQPESGKITRSILFTIEWGDG